MAFTHKYSLRRPPARLLVRFAVVLSSLIPLSVESNSQETFHQRTNLEVTQELLKEIGRSVLSQLHGPANDTLALSVASGDDRWVVEGSFLQAARETGWTSYLHNDSLPTKPYVLTVSGIRLDVRYDDVFRDGFLGSKKSRRTISTAVTCQFIRTATREALFSGSPTKEFTDTVSVDDIPRLERGASRGGRGDLPSEGFLDRAVEPLIIIGATGVAVFLFFHVRS